MKNIPDFYERMLNLCTTPQEGFRLGRMLGREEARNAAMAATLELPSVCDPIGPSLVCSRCFCRAAVLVDEECTLCREGKPPMGETNEIHEAIRELQEGEV